MWQQAFWVLLAYHPDEHFFEVLYDNPEVNLNGTDWEYDGDFMTPPPTSICAPIPLVNQTFTVAAGTVTNISIPLPAMLKDYDEVTSNGIHVLASQPISVYGVDYDVNASAAFTAYPHTLLGTNYCVLGRSVSTEHGEGAVYSKLTILATVDNTTVTITPSLTAVLAGHTNAYAAYTVTNLQAGQTCQIHSRNDVTADYTNDVTGTRIVSDQPIAVFAGANVAYVPVAGPSGIAAGNPPMQEQLPVESWGRQVLAVGFAGRMNGDSYRVVAAYDNTTVTITGRVVTLVDYIYPGPATVTMTNETITTNLDAGRFADLILDGPVEFQANQPIQVAHLANGTDFDGAVNAQGRANEGDPCETLLPSTGHWLLTNTVFALSNDDTNGDFDESFLNLIVAQSAITNTLVDGSHIATTNFVAIGSSGYYGAQIPVANGVHTVTGSQPVGIEVYGFGLYDAYAYFGGVVK
ncbi:MAG TPA: IgGFc-binding protein [Verrucomicrobiae bacterium]|nr:IgGFc-binding protein [Verrucomicrobiae bacterium]